MLTFKVEFKNNNFKQQKFQIFPLIIILNCWIISDKIFNSNNLLALGYLKIYIYIACIKLIAHLALSNVDMAELPIAPKPTPTAKPSGILCTVIAITSNIILFHCPCCISSMLQDSS